MRNVLRRYWLYLVIAAVCLGAGLGIGVVLPLQSPIQPVLNQYETDTSYKFINPLLFCGDDNFSHILNGKVANLQNTINTYITGQESAGAVDAVSVYFRELNGGQFFSINPNIQFVPASLLKVPLAMSIYLQAEQSPGLLTQKVFYGTPAASAHEYFTAPTLTASSTYSVEQLVDAMIIDSDNNAALLLTHVISTASLDQSYSDLGVITPQDNQYTMTVQSYAGFLRVLYNSTYLNHSDSEHLLDLLSRSTFTQGLVAGVPPGITVAHKFGERGYNNPAIPDQLHDCGIIYVKNPYLLCVMTQGNANYDTMAGVIANISKMVYAYAGL
jgi:beta-lactamase class A